MVAPLGGQFHPCELTSSGSLCSWPWHWDRGASPSTSRLPIPVFPAQRGSVLEFLVDFASLHNSTRAAVPKSSRVGRRTRPGSAVDPKFVPPGTARGPWAGAGALRMGTTLTTIPITVANLPSSRATMAFSQAGAELALWSTPKSCITHQRNIRVLWSQPQTSPRISRILPHQSLAPGPWPSLEPFSPARVKAEAAWADAVRNVTLLFFCG